MPFASCTALADPYLVYEADLFLGVSLGDSNQSRPANAGSRQDLSPTYKDMDALGLALEQGPLMFMVSLLRFRILLEMLEHLPLGSCMLLSGGWLNLGVRDAGRILSAAQSVQCRIF